MRVDALPIIAWQENDPPPFLKSWEIRLAWNHPLIDAGTVPLISVISLSMRMRVAQLLLLFRKRALKAL